MTFPPRGDLRLMPDTPRTCSALRLPMFSGRRSSAEGGCRRPCLSFEIGGKINGPLQYATVDEQASVVPGGDLPFDQRDAMVLDFYRGDASWMDAASIVEIIPFSGLRKDRAVGVTGDHHLPVGIGEAGQLPLDSLLFFVGSSRAGGGQKAQQLQRSPLIPDQKAGQRP